jgi:hypothetical protein
LERRARFDLDLQPDDVAELPEASRGTADAATADRAQRTEVPTPEAAELAADRKTARLIIFGGTPSRGSRLRPRLARGKSQANDAKHKER